MKEDDPMEQTTLDLCLFGGDGGAAAGAGDAAAEQATAEAARPAPSREDAFNRLISGEYRDEYVKRTQQMIDTRFKQSKELESRYNALRSAVDALGRHFGVDASAQELPDRLIAAVEEAARLQQAQPLTTDEPAPADSAQPLADDAAPAGSAQPVADETGDALPEGGEAPQEPADPRIYQRGKNPVMDRMVDRATDRWFREAWQLKNRHPAFDMAAEMNGPNSRPFLGMLHSGVPVQTAWQALHMDELLKNAIAYAVENTRQRTVDSIRARGLRPEEAAAGAPAAAAQILRADPATWDPDEMNSAIQQARMGKKIYL
jgi:hypothetical protein